LSNRSSRERTGELAHGSIGLLPVLFQSVVLMGPAVAVTFSLQPSLPFAGVALPLSALLALGMLLCVASSVGQLGRVFADAGGLYAYISQALGPRVGFVTAWINLFFQPFFAVLLYLVLTNILQSTFDQIFGVTISFVWFVFLSAAIVFALTVLGTRVSTEAQVILGLIELSVFLVLAIWLIIDAGATNTLNAFNPGAATEAGLSGVGKGAIFVILAFVGFEGSAVLGEESVDPLRIIPRAVVLSCLVVGIFYTICSYATVVGWGPGNLGNYAENPNPWQAMATREWGLGWLLVFFALINSGIANATAGVNSCSRVLYSMGRSGLLPGVLARTHPTFRTPHVAIAVNTVFAIIVALVAGWVWGPLTGFAVTATAFVIMVIVWYMLGCVACLVEYSVRRRHELNVLLHVVLPIIGFVALAFPLYYLYVPLAPYPIRLALWFAPAWIAVGVVLSLVLWQRRRDLVEDTQKVFMEE
jgi:amino acid transporter